MPSSKALIVGAAIVAILVALAPRLLARIRLARAVERERDQERPDVDLPRAAAYHRGLDARENQDAVDEATWADLNLDAVFVAVDRTVSHVGRQFLYHVLRQPASEPSPVARLESAIRRFSDDPAEAAKVRRILRPLAAPQAAYLTELLHGDLPDRPKGWWVFPVLTAASFACLLLLVVWPKALIVWLGICLINIIVQLVYRPRVRRVLVALQSIPAFAEVADQLARLNPTGLEAEITTLQVDAPQLRTLRRATTWLLFEPGATNDVLSSLYEYVNLLFLLDVNASVFSVQRVADARPLMRRVFEAIGRIDSCQSVAAWRVALPCWTVPEFSGPQKTLLATEVFHPLLATPVGNTLGIREASILVTGSNMSGKTTFMRTLGVNAILAQTLHTACARTWRSPRLHVRSSIGRSDSLLEGKSHYMAEVESVHALLRAKRPDRQHLFLLDEMFRGTNTEERVAAAYAVLVQLAQGEDIVVVATHDLELVDLLAGSYEMYHFRETITDNSLSFDYELRPGPSSTRNAIALLRLKQYPDEVIARAHALLDRKPAARVSRG